MSARSLSLIAAVALMGVGLLMVLADFLQPPPVVARVPVAVAAMRIEPYSIITQDMIKAGDAMVTTDAFERGAYPLGAVVGLMSTNLIAPGTLLTGVNAKPVEEVRYVQDLGLEVVTFAAGVDRTVGGKLRPGHLINLYGFGRDDQTRENFTALIEPRLWVVGVSANGQPVSLATPQPDIEDGSYREVGRERESPSTLITVAVTPAQAYHIIDMLGAEGLNAWATLAASSLPDIRALATAVPPAVAAAPTPDVFATLALLPTAVVFPGPPDGGFGGMAR